MRQIRLIGFGICSLIFAVVALLAAVNGDKVNAAYYLSLAVMNYVLCEARG